MSTVVGWDKESCLGPAEISSLRSWLNSRSTQGESKISTFSLIWIRRTKNWNKRRWVQEFLKGTQGRKHSLKIFRELLEERMCFEKACECVWNLKLQTDLKWFFFDFLNRSLRKQWEILLVVISKCCLWWFDSYWGGLKLKKLVNNDWVHVTPGLVLGSGVRVAP